MSVSSWIEGADGSGFGAEHLPYGVFSTGGDAPRVGVRVGDRVLDLARLVADGLLEGPFHQPALNPFMAEGPSRWREVRARLTELVSDASHEAVVAPALVPLADVELLLPFEVADYVDFYASVEHATNLGRLMRPDSAPLLPNWRHLPVGYHGRSGTIVVSGTPIRRPHGQRQTADGEIEFGPTTRLDIELEVGFVIGSGSPQGEPVSTADAPGHVFGVALVNDWSARDIQRWEGQPLGPFLGKSFATSVAAWVTPLDALTDCRVFGPGQDPPVLDYLQMSEPWGLGLDLVADLQPAESAAATTITAVSFSGLYWTFPQMIAHMTVNGASLRTGDLFASGTVSGSTPGSEGSLTEQTRGGSQPIDVGGVERGFLLDGDEVVLRGEAKVGDGARLTLGEVRGRILPA